jgi:serine protease Do
MREQGKREQRRLNMNTKRLIYLTLIVATLSIGVIIGSIVSGGVKATSEQQRPAVLTIPDPVAMSNSFSHIAEQLEPAVVNIHVVIAPKEPVAPPRRSQAPGGGGGGGGGRRPGGGNGGANGAAPLPGGDPADPNSAIGQLYGRLFGDAPPQEDPEPMEATGTGFIVDKAGYILTNHHVIENATKITVRLSDKSEYPARLVGSDSYTDLAVIKIDAGKDLTVGKFGNSDAVKTGDWVIAVGSPFGFDHTVTSGIISAKGRSADELTSGGPSSKGAQFQSFLQTDAAINPGNSGGPLVNMVGEVIGINTAIVSETNSFAGLGFALPSNIAIKVYNQLAQTGKVTRGSIGITYDDKPELLRAFGVNEGVIVKDILIGKPAAQAGIHVGDVITNIDGQKITSGPLLLDIIASSTVNRSVQVKILRGGKEQTIPVMIGDREKVIYDVDTASTTAPPDVTVPANPPDRVLGLAVQVAPQKVVKQFGLSGMAISSVQKGSVGAEIFDNAPVESPYVIDSVVVEGRVTEIRTQADFDRAVAALKRGAKFAFGVHVPERDGRGRFLNKYDHTFVALTMP